MRQEEGSGSPQPHPKYNNRMMSLKSQKAMAMPDRGWGTYQFRWTLKSRLSWQKISLVTIIVIAPGSSVRVGLFLLIL